MNLLEKQHPDFVKTMNTGILTGLAAVLINNAYFMAFYQNTSFNLLDHVNMFAITLASLFPCLIGALIYYGLTYYSEYPKVVYTVSGCVFLILSLLAPFSVFMPDGSPIPPGFRELTLPMHLVTGVLALLVIPNYSLGRQPH